MVAQTTTTEAAQSLLIFSEDRNIFQPLSRVPEIPTSLFTAAQFLRGWLYKAFQEVDCILQIVRTKDSYDISNFKKTVRLGTVM
ncbi:MAG: hypothetical protein O0V67_02620 [Methanocorpusculum sp.]|nr:hypothetical protein [Methanocorpusculum sp.]